jgi:hypothetical protein
MVMTNKEAAEWQKQLDKLQQSTLKELFLKHKCTKGIDHGYDKIYESDFKKLRNEPINILEIGVDQGRSIAVWLDYFPNANIYAMDIFVRMPDTAIKVLKNERVKYLKIDSTAPEVNNLIANWNVKFDIIIDDARHTPEANALTFKSIIPFLKPNGIYYIEDVWPLDEMSKSDLKNLGFDVTKQTKWMQKYRKGEFTENKWKMFIDTLKGYKIKKFDNRKKCKLLDSYIYKITK